MKYQELGSEFMKPNHSNLEFRQSLILCLSHLIWPTTLENSTQNLSCDLIGRSFKNGLIFFRHAKLES